MRGCVLAWLCYVPKRVSCSLQFFARAVATVGIPTTRIVLPERFRCIQFGDREARKVHAKQVSDAAACPHADMYVPVPFSAQPSPFKVKINAFESDRKRDFRNIFVMLNGFVCAC
jgi:hypothetical protein